MSEVIAVTYIYSYKVDSEYYFYSKESVYVLNNHNNWSLFIHLRFYHTSDTVDAVQIVEIIWINTFWNWSSNHVNNFHCMIIMAKRIL